VVSFAYILAISDIAFVHVLRSNDVNCQRLNRRMYDVIDDNYEKRESK
jgi:hypothetical protein